LLDHLIPLFEKKSGIQVKTVAVGTGQALELGRLGEADVLLVHAPSRERKIVAEGKAANRRAVMHNDFVILGPAADPAGLAGEKDAAAALATIAEKQVAWVSRADDSGTHTKERALWQAAGVAPGGPWFAETGQGMGASLRIASEKKAHILSDRGTFLATDNLELVVLVEGDQRLFNPYHVLEVVGPRVNNDAARALADFFVSAEAQQAIADYRVAGQRLFTPDARD
jgi:tungstate transport system substrate-binding protein